MIDLDGDDAVLLNIPRRIADILPKDKGRVIVHSPEELEESEMTYLIDSGYLIKDIEIEQEIKWFKEYVKTVHRRTEGMRKPIGVIVSNTCNLACPYCFQSHSISGDSDLTIDQATDIISFIKGHAKLVSHLELYGGEPLTPTTRDVVDYIVNEAEKIKLTCRVTTNGVYLKDFINLIDHNKINFVQVTLDGSARFHDKRRVDYSGNPTFHTIFKNVKEIVEKGITVYIRSNVDESNLIGLTELIKDLDNEGILYRKNILFNYIAVKKIENGLNKNKYERSCVTNNNAVERYLDQVAEDDAQINKFIRMNIGFEEYLQKIIEDPQIVNCGACDSNIYFSPENYLYNCHERTNNPSYAIGYFNERSLIFNESREIWTNRLVSSLNNCTCCSLALVHGGGCPGDLSLRTKTGNCSSFPEEFDEYLRILYRRHKRENLQHGR